MKWGLIAATAVIKIIVLCQTVVKQNASFIKPTLTVTSLDINKNVTLAHVKQHLKIVSGIIKSRSTHLKHKNDRELSKEFWEIKKCNATPKITWKIIRICPFYNPNSKRSFLFLNEKCEIATYKGDNLLNKRTEILNTCRHRSKYKLADCETIDWTSNPTQYDTITMSRFKTVMSYFVNLFS